MANLYIVIAMLFQSVVAKGAEDVCPQDGSDCRNPRALLQVASSIVHGRDANSQQEQVGLVARKQRFSAIQQGKGTKSDPADYENAYEDLYKNHGYHSDTELSHEANVIEDLLNFTRYATDKNTKIREVVVLGCSHGKGAAILHDAGFNASGVDVAETAVQMAIQTRGRTCGNGVRECFKQGSLTQIPFDTGSFDAGISADVLEHIAENDVPLVVAEISRVVKYFLFLQIASFSERAHNGEEAGMGNLHLTTKDNKWWTAAFARNGWKVVTDRSTAQYVNLFMTNLPRQTS
jgi:2-polyprenyl-3-methyl-5-hydroxy-6-metoxy-1,4-benzoquinol methylase|mmetsp:Transcript_6735/g.10781  ORF Transcript_6735/g.10781 Transcript_6735/m.10781 type:complete len:291 (+) Transcript_6735:59-931(+)